MPERSNVVLYSVLLILCCVFCFPLFCCLVVYEANGQALVMPFKSRRERQRLVVDTRARIRKLEKTLHEKKKKLAELRQDKSNLKKLLFTSKNENFPDLAAQRSELLTNGIKIADIKNLWGTTIESLMNIYLRSCIDFSEDLESRNEDESLREKYKAFGLLLSGCIKGKPESKIETKKVIAIIQSKQNFVEGIEPSWDNFATESLEIICLMLSLLPPLMVIQPKWYHEEVQDTLNSTWEEGSCKPLIYYRPVLVLGNKLQVFEKGYVGNTTGPVVRRK